MSNSKTIGQLSQSQSLEKHDPEITGLSLK
jgi:hypothetical protein